MIYAVVGAVLFGLGVIVGRVGPKLGTALAVAPVVVWFVLLAQMTVVGRIDGPDGQALALSLVVGLLTFVIGANLTSRRSRNAHREGAE